MPLKTRVARTLLAAAVAAVPLVGLAQVRTLPAPVAPQPPRGGLNPDSFYGKESFQGVSVRDSLEAIKKLEDARRMERLEDWNKAADWYQEVIEKYGDRVVPSGTDEKNNIRQYTGIERPVQEQLAKWPKAGLDAYRNRYGAVAATMLEGARRDDQETLSRVMKLYFVTESGKDAGLRLIDLLLERGEFAEAARIGDRLLDWHPTLEAERAKVLFRTSLAYHLSGDAKRAKERADQLKDKFAGAVGTLFGKDVVLADSLERLLQNAPPVSVATNTDSFRLNPGGDESRSMISAATGRPGARMASIELAAAPPIRGLSPQQQREIEASNRGDRDGSGGLGVLPVVDDGEMFFQDGSRVYGVSLQSGVPLSGWAQQYPATNGQYTINAYALNRNQQYTLTLTNNAVLGVMGQSARLEAMGGMQVYGSDKGTRLVCLDRATGRERWAARPSKIPEENLRSLDLSGSPLVVGDNVYVVGRGGKNVSSEDCYVLCFDLNSGSYKWSCFVASANNAGAFMGQGPTADTLSHLAYSSGRVYVVTNLGACAALDAYSGTISWLNIYPRDGAGFEPQVGWRGMGRATVVGGGSTKSWEFNPIVVAEGKVFLLPTDGKHVLVYDAGSGAEVKRIAVADFKREGEVTGAQSLWAVDGKELICAGGKTVYCIDWTEDWAKVPDKYNERYIHWTSDQDKDIRGRGFVTADSVFFCTATNLQRITRFRKDGSPDGRVVDSYPGKQRTWDEGETPGNVVVTGDQVIVAGAKRVNIYADMDLARRRLDDDVAAAPTDPGARLRYAEVMFVAGQLPVAMEKLDETVRLLGGLESLRPGPDRDHLFNDCVTFARKLQKDKKDESSDKIDERIAAINRLYDLAAAAADGDSQQVNYRIQRARFNRDYKDEGTLENAIRLYQEILTNAKLRTVPQAMGEEDPTGGVTQAALVAEKHIDDVKKLRPSAYEAFEKKAQELLVDAGDDPAMLKAVAEQYPNSAAAAKAMTAAAVAFEAKGDYRLAAYTLRQAYGKYGDTADKPRMLEDMARTYLAMPDRTADRVDTAAARLSTIVKLGNGNDPLRQPLKLADGKVLAEAGTTVTDALKSVQNYKSEAVSAKLADFHIPAPPNDEQRMAIAEATRAWRAAGADPAKKPRYPDAFEEKQVVIPNVSALIKPPLELRQRHSRHDRVAAYANGGLVLYPVGSANPAGQSNELTNQPNHLAWLGDGKDLLVWSNTEIALLDGATAGKRWKLELKALPKIEVVSGGGAADETMAPNAGNDGGPVVEEQQFLNGQRMIIRRRIINGRMVNQVQAVGQFAQQQAIQQGGPEAIVTVKPVDDKILVSTSAGQLFAIRAADGTLAWHTRLASAAPISRMVATDDFVVCKVDDQANTQLVVVDTLTGQLARARMSFPNETGNVPVNLALAPDGMLVWTQQDRLCGKDLFEPKRELNYEIVANANEGGPGRGPNIVQMDAQLFSPIFSGAVNPDQLQISEGRIIAVTHLGTYVSLYSLETGKLLDYPGPDGRRAEARLSTVHGDGTIAVKDWGVGLHLIGSKLYVVTRQNGPVCYNLDRSGMLWGGTIDRPTTPSVQFQEPFIGQDYFVIVDRPTPRPAGGPVNVNPQAPNANPNAATSVRLHCYTRAAVEPGSDRESGRIGHYPYVRDDSGITEFQGVDGGFYYLTGDQKLHFLKGARK